MNTTVRVSNIHLGFEIGSGVPVEIPLNHMAVTGQTQMSGKTTTLEALISRAEGLRAVAFVTKRAEGRFRDGRRTPPYFRERADWQFVSAILEATLRERLKFERSWIMRACKGARTLADVQRNVREAMKSAKGLSADVYLTLDEYLQIVVPQIQRLPLAETLDIGPGLNVIDVAAYSTEMQALVIRSVLEWVYERERDVVVIIPEAWEFIPQQRGSPVLLSAEELIRKGAAARNFVWLDSQDIAAVHKNVLRSVVVWILGVQREANEVKRMLAHITSPKPSIADVMHLGKGVFFACWGQHVLKVYVQPAWLNATAARQVALGQIPEPALAFFRPEESDDDMSAEERGRYEEEASRLRQATAAMEIARDDALRQAEKLQKLVGTMKTEAEELTRQLLAATDASKSADALRAALLNFVKLSVPGPDRKAPYLDLHSLAREVAALLPAGGSVVQVTPPEALRKQFQTEEVARIVAFLGELEPRPRSALLLLESTGNGIGMKALAERLGIPTAGNSFVTFSKALKDLIADGYLTIQERQGVRGNLRGKIAEDLNYYQATAEDVEQTYQHCLATMAERSGGS